MLGITILTIGTQMILTPVGKCASTGMKLQIRPSWMTPAERMQISESQALEKDRYQEKTRIDWLRALDSDREITARRQAFERDLVRMETQNTVSGQSVAESNAQYMVIRDQANSAFQGMTKDVSKNFAREKTNALKAENSNTAGAAPVGALVVASALYTGREMKARVSDGVLLRTRADLKDRQGSIALQVFDRVRSQMEYSQQGGIQARVLTQLTERISADVSTQYRGTVRLQYGIIF